MATRYLPLLLIGLAACNALPRDPEGTLNRVTETKVVRVGMTQMSARDRASAERLIAIVAKRTQARAKVTPVTTETGFAALYEGRLDLVIGPFEKDSPWATDVSVGPPLVRSGSKDHPIELKAAMRNGENRCIMLVEDASRQVSPEMARR